MTSSSIVLRKSYPFPYTWWDICSGFSSNIIGGFCGVEVIDSVIAIIRTVDNVVLSSSLTVSLNFDIPKCKWASSLQSSNVGDDEYIKLRVRVS